MRYLDRRLLHTALGIRPADTIITGGALINVHSGRLMRADVAISQGRIAAIGEVARCHGPATEVIEATGKFLCPGLIEPHYHPETTKVTITSVANALVPKGTTSMVTAFDYMGMVAGCEGMRWSLDEAGRTPLKIFFTPVCRIPYSRAVADVGPHFGPQGHQQVQAWPETVGYWEMCSDHVGVLDEEILRSVEVALENGHRISGHCPGMDSNLAACVAIGMRDDHEVYTLEDAAAKVSNGVYCLLKQMADADRIPDTIRAITELGLPSRYFTLCNDDVDSLYIEERGNIDHLIRYIIQLGVDPITAIQMGTLNPAECFRIDHLVGSITPGRWADILILNDLERFDISSVIVNGVVVAEGGQILDPIAPPEYPPFLYQTLNVKHEFTAEDFYVHAPPGASRARILCIARGKYPPRAGREVELDVAQGRVLPDPDADVCYVSVIERHTGLGQMSTAFIAGLGIKRGAVGTSISGDNNLLVVGACPEDMALAVNHIVKLGGGQAVVEHGQVVADVALPIGGMLSDMSVHEMAEKEGQLNRAAQRLGSQLERPLFSLMLLTIVEVPDYGLTYKGVLRSPSGEFVDPIIATY
jgi:adenine deaminase